MPEEVAEKVVIKQPENPMVFEIERNGVVLKFTEQRTTRGAVRGKTVFDPDDSDKELLLKWGGIDNVAGTFKQKVRGLSIGWFIGSTDEDTGEFNRNEFIELAKSFDASGETIGDLEEQQEEAKANMLKCDNAILGNPAHPSYQEEIAKFMKFGMECNRLQVAINKKSRPRKVKQTVNA